MNIAEITKRLNAHGVKVSEGELDAFLAKSNLAADDISDDTAIAAIAEDLKRPTSSALATAPKAGKAAKSPKRSTRKERTQSLAQEFQGAIATATKSTAVELETMADVVRQGAASYTEGAAQSIVDDLREIPLNVVRRVGELAAQEVADPDTFRSAITSVLPFDWFNAPTDAA